MPRQGEEFHRLVEVLERAVVDHPNVTVESPKFLTDKVTGELREHDIVLTQRSPQRTTITAIECRDRSRRVGVNQVEEFRAKCEHTGVNKPVIVSRLGFFKTALKKAAHYGIDCLTFSQVESVDWVHQSEVAIRERNVVHADMQIAAADTLQGKSATLFMRFDEGGPDEEIDLRVVAGDDDQITLQGRADSLIQMVFKQLPDPSTELSGIEPIEVTNLDSFYFRDEDGVEHPLRVLRSVFHWEAKERVSPFTFHHYGSSDGNPFF
jgi:Restriction endonuclease